MTTKRIITLIIILAIAAYGVNRFIIKKSVSNKSIPKIERTEPSFEPEGELSFINSVGDTIETIDIEIADNENERMQGLMFRSNMGFDRGMLFIFDYEEEQSFWMKNTKMSLDILYVNSQLEIVTIYRHTQPYSKNPIPSFKPALYVVEVSAGYCDRFSVTEGDRISFAQR